MAWIGAVVGAVAPSVINAFSGGGGSHSGGGASGGGQQYVPTGLGAADAGWQQAYGAEQGIANQTQGQTAPYYQQSLNQMEGMNYQPYLNAANQAGQMYGQAGQMAQGQMQGYSQQAQQAQQAGQQMYQTSMDPQNALFNQTQQTLQDQVRAGQASRGLGNSAVGGMEEANAMSNFDINWQNNQLQRQQQGIQGMASANNMYGQDQSAALAAGAAGAGYYGQSGSVPMQAQQYAAQQPGAAAGQYQAQMAGLQSMYGNQMSQAIPYMNNGQGAQQSNYTAQTAQNAQESQLFGQIGSAFAPQISQGISNLWNSGSSGGGTPTWGGQTTSAGGSADAYNLFGPAGYG